jgi:hypothetical protein
MNRGLSAGNLAAIDAATTYPVLLWYGDFASGAVRITTHPRDISWGGYTWTALGDLVGFSEIKETEEVMANPVEFFLNGASSGLLVKALEAGYRRRACILYIGFLDTSDALVADPIAFPYNMDRMPIRRTGEEWKISLMAESVLVDMQRSSELRCTHQQQQYRYPGDLGFEYVEGIVVKDVPVGTEVSGGAGLNPKATYHGGVAFEP